MDHYGKRLEDIEENVRMEQSGVSFTGQVSIRDSSFPIPEILILFDFFLDRNYIQFCMVH